MIAAPALIPVAAPWITEREGELARQAAMEGWGPDHYRFNRAFEEAFAAYIGVRHAVSLPHATAGLHLALAALGVGPGDEVVVPAVTWIASVAPVVYVGAEPVFADIDPVTWCLDPQAAAAAITPKTKAILGVDLYGSMCDWPALRALAEAYGLALIEDAAEALGSTLHGRRAGAWGDAAAFSFHGSKTLVTGEGGMLVTDSDAVLARVQSLRDHGRPPGDRFFQNTEVAFKYKMPAVAAGLGLAQMERIDALVARKREIFGWYRQRLGGLNGLRINAEPEAHENSAWMVTAIPDAAHDLDKFTLMARLRERNIDSRPFFSALPEIEAFADRPEAARFLPRPMAGASAAKRGVNLPSGYTLTEGDVDLVCRALAEILEGA
ncbi:MAG: DegT/DnrJ/EryC1/StrS family aminotransferase [Pseudomonadota bacterium]